MDGMMSLVSKLHRWSSTGLYQLTVCHKGQVDNQTQSYLYSQETGGASCQIFGSGGLRFHRSPPTYCPLRFQDVDTPTDFVELL